MACGLALSDKEMGETETITVADVSEGPDEGAPVELPVVEVLTGRAFLTGKSGSGKSNSASVVCEKLLDEGFGVLIVDIEGEYYGLKEEYEILHAGADEECDIQVSPEHAGKLASLALEDNVPIILDLSGFLDEAEGKEMLTEVARRLFAKEKKVKQPFLLLVEEIHEYVPEGGGLDECGRMLIKVAKRGRKHGLGVAGISQRPADVKKDFITQCDWLVWHRLTWRNDTKVVKRVLGSEYAEAVEELNDGEGFLMTDWGEDLRRVQFRRKQTFDAGATPGLEDFERPDLKSVSGDLVSELKAISQEQAERENELARLRNELEEREQRIAELKEELAEARDLERMAEQFARAMTQQVEGRVRSEPPQTGQAELHDYAGEQADRADERAEDGAEADGDDEEDEANDLPFDEVIPPEQQAIVEDAVAANGVATPRDGVRASENGAEAAVSENGTEATVSENGAQAAPESGVESAEGSDLAERRGPVTSARPPAPDRADPEAVADHFRDVVAGLDDRTRKMLSYYRQMGMAAPEDVYEAAGGSGERAPAYGRNRTLRKHGFVVHVGGGRYAYAVPALLEAFGSQVRDDERARLLARIESPL